MTLTPFGAVHLSAAGLTAIAAVVWFPSATGALACVLVAAALVGLLPLRQGPPVLHRAPDTCFAGIRADGSVTVTNPSRLFPIVVGALIVHYREPRIRRPARLRAPGPWVVGPGQSRRLSYALHCLRRGTLRFEAVELEVGGIPPVAVRRFRTAAPGEMTVFPRPAMVRVPVPVRARGLERPVTAALMTRRGSEDEFSGLREYVPGDSIRHIHWRTSFKFPGRLRVMEFAGSEAGQARIFVDPWRGEGGRHWRLDFERAVSAAGALWDYLDRQGIFVTMELPEGRYSGRHMLRPMLDSLSRLVPTDRPADPPPPDLGTALFWFTAGSAQPRLSDEDLFVLTPERVERHFQVL